MGLRINVEGSGVTVFEVKVFGVKALGITVFIVITRIG